MADDSSEEDDYMTMVLPDAPSSSKSQSSLSRAEQRRRDNANRGISQSNKALEHDRLKRLERGLRTNIGAEGPKDHDWPGEGEPAKKSKGAAMLAKLGYKGGPLGRAETKSPDAATTKGSESATKVDGDTESQPKDSRLVDPIRVQIKNNKRGIGAADEEEPGMKRARQALDAEEARLKRLRGELDGYRERVAREGAESRVEGQWWAAMRIAETLREQDAESKGANTQDEHAEEVPLVLRPLVRQRREQDQEKELLRTKKALFDRKSEDEDDDDKITRGEALDALPVLEEDEDEDKELDDFLALPVAERLHATLLHLRDKFWYCFWCKAKYDDATLEGCPGVDEEMHD